MVDEERVYGRVTGSVYKYFARKGGGIFALFFFGSIFTLECAARMSTDYWLAIWTAQPSRDDFDSLCVYLALIGGFIVIAAIRVLALAVFTMRTANSLHGDMLTNVFRAPLSFFESSPIGRTMSRFSRDIEVVDILLPDNLNDLFLCLVQLVIAVLASSYFVPVVLVPFVFLAFFAYRVQSFYRSSARELQRLENIHRSPVLSHVTETLAGAHPTHPFYLIRPADLTNPTKLTYPP
jgi:ATP-binding cassette subfamily C (CFTR/MRP) protein 1